jgi:hypothetical protein
LGIVESRFHVLQSRTRFRRCGGRRVPFSCFSLPDTFRQCGGRRVSFSCFALSDSFSAVARASDPVSMFCSPGHVFGGMECVGSRFHVLRSQTCFRRFRGRQVPFSCFASPYSFSAIPRASDPVFMFCAPGHVFDGAEGFGSGFMFCAPGLVFGGSEGVGSNFLVLCPPCSFLTVTTASGPVFMFCAPEHVFGGAEGVVSLFHVLRSRTRFRRCEGRRDSFSCFALLDSFSAILRASCPVFMFCASVLIFGGTDGVRSHFHVLHLLAHFRRCGGRRVPFSCFALLDSFSAVLFSCFALPDSFAAFPRALGPVFMFCAPGIFFSCSEGVKSRFHVLRPRTRFRR